MQMPNFLSNTNQQSTSNITIIKTPTLNILFESMIAHYIYLDQSNFHLFYNLIAAPAANVYDYIDDEEY